MGVTISKKGFILLEGVELFYPKLREMEEFEGKSRYKTSVRLNEEDYKILDELMKKCYKAKGFTIAKSKENYQLKDDGLEMSAEAKERFEANPDNKDKTFNCPYQGKYYIKSIFTGYDYQVVDLEGKELDKANINWIGAKVNIITQPRPYQLGKKGYNFILTKIQLIEEGESFGGADIDFGYETSQESNKIAEDLPF